MASELHLLRSNREELVAKIRLAKPFLDRLLQYDEIVQEECEEIVAKVTPQDRARALLDIVEAKGRGAFRHFREHLKKVNPELEEVLHRCPKHNLRLKLYCEECEQLLCLECRSDDHKDHRYTSVVAEGDAIRREFTAFKRENRKILIEHREGLNDYDIETMRRELDDRMKILKERFSAKVDEERRWFLGQLGVGGVTLSPAPSVSSIATSGSVAGSETNYISDCADPATTPLSVFSSTKANVEVDGEDDETIVSEDQTTLCDDLQNVHLDLDEISLDLLEDFCLPLDDKVSDIMKELSLYPTVDLLHSFGESGTKAGQFNGPNGLTISPKGRMIVADVMNNRVQVFDADGKWERELATKTLLFPTSVSFRTLRSPGDVLVTCPAVGALRRLYLTGSAGHKFNIKGIYGVAMLDRGYTVLISESVNNTVVKYKKTLLDGKIRYRKTVTCERHFRKPRNINTDNLSNIYVSDIGDGTVKVLGIEGQVTATIGKDILRHPTGTCVDKEGNIIVADAANNTLEIFSREGHHLNTLIPKEEGLKNPQEIAFTPDGTKLVVVDGGNDCVKIYSYKQAVDANAQA